MKILGIDQSLTNTGIYFWSEKKEAFHSIKPKKLRDEARLKFIYDQVEAYLREYEPDLVVIEGYSFGSRGRAIFQLGELGGMLKMLLYNRQTPFRVIPPTTHKKALTGRGNANKAEVMDYLENMGLKVADDNQADAYSLVHAVRSQEISLPNGSKKAS